MSSRLKILLAFYWLLLSGLACVTLLGKVESPSTSSIEPPAQQLPIEAASCPAITDQIIQFNSNFSSAQTGTDSMDFSSRDANTETYLVTYLVAGDEISQPYREDIPADLQAQQNDTVTQQRLWNYFTLLIPRKDREMLAKYSIMTDGPDNVLAAVSQTGNDPALWSLEVDIADSQNYYYLTYTFVHEFAHLLTLNAEQVPPSEAIFNNPDDNNIYLAEVAACPNYFPGEGCSNADSYINQFYSQFWGDIHEEWNSINLEEDDDVYYQRLDDFYSRYQDQFVTDYAVTNPEEDIAESFAFFVFSPQPAGVTIAEQKMLFFYQYPELVNLRANILNNLCKFFPQ